MSKIISKDSKYYYSGYDGIWNKDEKEYLIDGFRSYEKYRVFKSRGKYGVCDLEYNIIADPDYTSTYKCGKSSLNYKIELNDATHKTYYIYGTINIEGVARQDLRLYSPSSSMIGMDYTYIVPNDFVFVAHLFGYYYLFQRKGGLYGILRYGWNLKAEILHNMHYTYFNNFIFDDPYKLRICLFNTNPDNQIIKYYTEFAEYHYKILDALNIKDKVIVQAGFSCDYKSKNMEIFDLIAIDKFNKLIKKCDILITHGGVGSIVSGLKNNKKVIACPRLKKYGEHVNDHQLQIVENFCDSGYILKFNDGDNLADVFNSIKKFKPKKFEGNNENFINLVKNEIERFL